MEFGGPKIDDVNGTITLECCIASAIAVDSMLSSRNNVCYEAVIRIENCDFKIEKRGNLRAKSSSLVKIYNHNSYSNKKRIRSLLTRFETFISSLR